MYYIYLYMYTYFYMLHKLIAPEINIAKILSNKSSNRLGEKRKKHN